MDWDVGGDNNLFAKTTEAVVIGGKTVAYVGRLVSTQKAKGIPTKEIHFFDANMKRTGFISLHDQSTAILKLENGEEMSVRPSVMGEALIFARVLAERPEIKLVGLLFGTSLIRENPRTYSMATISQLNQGLVKRTDEFGKKEISRGGKRDGIER